MNKKFSGSLCVPVLNESENVQALYLAFIKLTNSYTDSISFELIITDNHSSDESWNLVKELARHDSRVRAYRFGRNIGYQKSILFALKRVKSDFAVQLDADLQDSPDLIPTMIEKWLQGAKVVSGKRVSRSESKLTNFIRRVGYSILAKSSAGVLEPNVGDFRLLDRDILDLLQRVTDPNPYLRGIISRFAFPETFIEYKRSPRQKGVSKFKLTKVLSLGWNGFLTYSRWPLLFVNVFMLFSITVAITSFIFGTLVIFSQIDASFEFVVITFLLSVVLLLLNTFLAVALFYLRKIHDSSDDQSVHVINHLGEFVAYKNSN